MNTRQLRIGSLFGLFGAVNVACSGGLQADDASGGRGVAAGSANTGGAAKTASGGAATGGATMVPSTGGTTNTGGAASTGGTRTTGGTMSTGGTTAVVATGGSRTTGGATSTGGASMSTGGAIGQGGLIAAAGAAAPGGKSATAGALSASGSAGRVVVVATGGSPASGGTVTTGGSTATTGGTATTSVAGTAGTSVSPATGGTTSTGSKCFNFETSTEGWKKSYAIVFSETDRTVQDAAASAALLANTIADWMDSPGYGGVNGFARLTIPFATSQTDYQGLMYSYLPTVGLDLSGKTIHAFVKLVSGMTADDPSKPSGARLIIKTGADWFYADGGWVNMAKSEWIELMFTVNSPARMDTSKDASLYDPTDVREIAVSFDTSGSATTVVSPGVVYLDKVCY